MKKILATVLATAALLGTAGNASARSAGERISVSATVISTCLASSSLTAPGDASSLLAVRCSSAWPVTVSLNADSVAAGLLAANLMKSSGGLAASLYARAAHMTAWADRTGSIAAMSAALDPTTVAGPSLGDAGGIPSAGILTVTISY